MTRLLTLTVLIASAALAGCETCPDRMVSVETLVHEYNANAALTPRLWARAKVQITTTPEDGALPVTWGSVSSLATPNGLLMLEKSDDPAGPHNFVLIIRETAGVELCRIGVSADEGLYYFWYNLGDDSEAYFGQCELAGAPGVRALPVNPNDLVSVLGICELPGDLTQLPAVAMTMDRNPGDCAYVLNYLNHQAMSERILITKQMRFLWADDKRRDLTGIQFFNGNGIDIMTADVDDFERILSADGSVGPTSMPTSIDITWADMKAEIRLVLSEMTTDPKWDPAVCRFWDHLPAGLDRDRIVQVDEHLIEVGVEP